MPGDAQVQRLVDTAIDVRKLDSKLMDGGAVGQREPRVRFLGETAGWMWNYRSLSEGNRTMTIPQPNNPLHGVTLEMMLRQMIDQFGWEGLARDMPINCFLVDPTLASALKYLRKAPRARQKVENIYLGFVAGRKG